MMTLKISKKLTIKKVYWLGLLGIASIQALSVNPCFAQSSNIVTDDSLGNETSQIEKNSQRIGLPVEIIRGGAQRGINLFHSLREFNVSEGRGAYFFSPNAEIQNILTRVTGNNRSDILGTLGTFGNSQPNLFLINPNGILFGENASLDVQGSFVGTTANGVQFGERGVFSATNPEAPALLTVNPSALFFNQVNAQASIQNNSVAPAQQSPAGEDAFGLRVPDGKSLLLLGGNVSMDGGGLNAFGGRVELGGLAEPGTVALDINGDNFRLGFPENVKRGDVSLANEAGVYVAADDGGDIVVNSQNLEMTTKSLLNAGIGSGLGSDNGKAGNIDVNTTGIVRLNNSDIFNDVQAEARGQGGDVNIIAKNLLVQNGAKVSSNTKSKGKGGNLTVNAQDVQLIGRDEDGGTPSGLFAFAYPNSTGDAGKLTVSTNELLVQDGAQVSANAFSKGNAGQLIIETNKLLVQNGAKVNVNHLGEGEGGELTINAEEILIRGNVTGRSTGIYAEASILGGDGGNLTIETNKLLVQDGWVSTRTFGEGKGGDLTINAQDVQLIGESRDGFFVSGLYTTTFSTGNAGNLTLSTNKLLVQDGAQVSTSTLGEGKGGDLSINAQDVQLIGDDAGLYTLAEYLYSTKDAAENTHSTNK